MSPEAAPDLLSDVLVDLQLRTGVLCAFDMTAPWGMTSPKFGPALVYALIEGRALMDVDGETPFWMEAGDIVLLPAGDGAALRSEPNARVAEIPEIFNEGQGVWEPGQRRSAPIIAHHGGGGERTLILVVLLEYADTDHNPLGLNLPRLIHLKRDDNRMSPWLGEAARSAVEEAESSRLGYFAMATRLAELVFINAVRTHLTLNPEGATGWLRGAADGRIARTLSAMHRRPGDSWSVERLAKEAGMSRSAFAERFRSLVGETPHDYLTRLRMRLAGDWITKGGQPVKAVAEQLGFASDKSFSQAFRRTFGLSPSVYRQASALAAPVSRKR